MNLHFGHCFELSPDKPDRRWKSAFGVFAFSKAGRLFINPALVGMKASGWLCASSDGEELLITKKATLVPLDWAVREKPDLACDLLKIKQMCESEAVRLMESEGR